MTPSSEGRELVHDSRALARYDTAEGAVGYSQKFGRSAARARTHRREAAILRSFLTELDPKASVLDLPCGAGRFARLIANGERSSMTFADASAQMLEEARAANARFGIDERVDYRQVDVTKDDPVGEFDVVVCVRLLHHLKDGAVFERALDHMTRCAKHDLVVTFASASTWKGFWRRLKTRLGLRRRGESIMSTARMREALAERGFRQKRIRFVSRLFSTQTWILASRD